MSLPHNVLLAIRSCGCVTGVRCVETPDLDQDIGRFVGKTLRDGHRIQSARGQQEIPRLCPAHRAFNDPEAGA